jgi:predicted nucleotidyltransferase
MSNYPGLQDARAIYSRNRLAEFRNRLEKLQELKQFTGLTIFAAGSYGRLEASEHSDIDVFFFISGNAKDLPEPRTNQIRMFARVIDIADHMKFPKFSNDCEYLVLLYTDDLLANLGGRIDDHGNYFTARMLFLLESRCLFGDEMSRTITSEIVSSYFKDFPDHPRTFQPTFLINDICRFWKTMLLNYEHKRHLGGAPEDQLKKTKQKVRNFKLKHSSRMTTCFASIAALGSFTAPVTEEQVINVTGLTPKERLESVVERLPSAKLIVEEVLNRYAWFLEMTGLPTEELEEHFSDKAKRTDMFKRANDYGDSMFRLLQHVDASDERLRLLRTLVI